MENEKVKILTIKDILNKKEECKKRKETKYAYVYSEFLGGALKAHSLNKGFRNDVRERMKEDAEKGVNFFIYISIDKLQDEELLEATEFVFCCIAVNFVLILFILVTILLVALSKEFENLLNACSDFLIF